MTSPGNTPENGGVLRYQVREHGDQLKELGEWRRDVDRLQLELTVTVKTLVEQMGTLGVTVNDLRRTLLGLAITIAGSAIVALFTVLVATGKI